MPNATAIGEHQDEEDHDEGDHKLQHNAAIEYKYLIGIQAAKWKGGIKQWLYADPSKVRRPSLREEVLEKAVLSHGMEIISFTQRNILKMVVALLTKDSDSKGGVALSASWMVAALLVKDNNSKGGGAR
ncbi:hypothetical protein F0562_001667 [Nyssa sinensis]|uniref:Uncharacterized protein n=1 Tax=Nyssa sinensis TaxID=561372 RepID=A0A5J5C4T2_9ASTE|nr:hypothetical protein F0562_001667 [Nyssa sinensis]